MMQMLVRQGIPAENILGGVGKATAYLAVQLKKTPEAAAEFAAKMQDATGTASEDMMGCSTLSRRRFIWALTIPTCCPSSLKPVLF